MSTVLVTGSSGEVGRAVVRGLAVSGHQVREFDVLNGLDVRDASVVASATSGCDALVHLAAVDVPEPASLIVDTIVMGCNSVLEAAILHAVPRVVLVSSVDVLGVFLGEAEPDYLPIDDDHPCRPTTPYGSAKLVAEQLAARRVAASGLEVICLRPPGVCTDETVEWLRGQRVARASFEWDPIWEYGAWIHVDDLAAAICAAFCPSPPSRFACHLVAAADINSDVHRARELADRIHPTVPWRGGAEYESDPTKSLVNSSPARALLGWTPVHRWRT